MMMMMMMTMMMVPLVRSTTPTLSRCRDIIDTACDVYCLMSSYED